MTAFLQNDPAVADISCTALLSVRAVFGATSREYKQFIARGSAKEEEEIEQESAVGEAE